MFACIYINDSLHIYSSNHVAYHLTRNKSQSPSEAREMLYNLVP